MTDADYFASYGQHMYDEKSKELDAAQAEIARLQADVERLTATHVDWDGVRCIVYGDVMWVSSSDYYAARNDALEEAALECGHHLSTEDDVILANNIAERILSLKETA